MLNERHLKRLMTEYVRYYHQDGLISGLKSKHPPIGRLRETMAQVAPLCPCCGSAVSTIATGLSLERVWARCLSEIGDERSSPPACSPVDVTLYACILQNGILVS